MNAPDASGVASGCTATPQTLIDEILASPASFYNNVHTTDYPGRRDPREPRVTRASNVRRGGSGRPFHDG